MAQLPHVLKRIRLNLTRSRDFPIGSDRHGYEFVAPLDRTGHIDPEIWKDLYFHCGVKRFWEGEGDRVGRLAYRPDGGDEPWFFDYESDSTADDEVGHRFASTPFVNGQYVSIRDDEDEVHTFIVVAVDNAT